MKPDMEQLEKRLKAHIYSTTMETSPIETSPHPFPGNYPTRVYWRIDTTWYYGKPHAYQMKRFTRLYRGSSSLALVRYLEFDKLSPVVWYRAVWDKNTNLCLAYFPWKSVSFPWGNTSRNILNLGAIKIYCPVLRLDFEEYISAYEKIFGKPTKAWCFPLSPKGKEL